MKIVHVVSSDTGGAARAAIRINESLSGLENSAIENKVLVVNRITSSEKTESIATTKFKKLQIVLYNIFNKFTIKKYNPSSLFSNSVMGFDISTCKDIIDCDIINLHWINEGMLSYDSLKQLKALNKPIVWTLHDMWSFTGGCHYDEECGRYKENCGNCKVLKSNKNNDISSSILKTKMKIYENMNITIVGCSNWITSCAKESTVFKDKNCINIPNAINTKVYKPISKEIAKDILNIETQKKIILFGAMSSTSDVRKGFKYLLESVKYLDKDKYLAVVFGNNDINEDIEKYLETKYFGKLSDDYTLNLLYNAADVFVAPSIQENLANTVMESLACGTPVVAFNIGGMADMIKHKYNGYLSNSFDSEDLAKGIIYSVENNEELGSNARLYVVNNYDYNEISKRYYDLYESLTLFKCYKR